MTGSHPTRKKWTLRVSLAEWWDEMHYPHRWQSTRRAMCSHGFHWPIRWDENAYPMSYDPPEPPEAWWACETCGKVMQKGPYRRWMWWVRSWVTHPLFMWREVWPALPPRKAKSS